MKNFQHFYKYYRDTRKEKINRYKEILKKCYYLKFDDEIILDKLNEADQYLILNAMLIEVEIVEDHAKEEKSLVEGPSDEEKTCIRINLPDDDKVYFYNVPSFKSHLRDIEILRKQETQDQDYVGNFCYALYESNYCQKEDVHIIENLPLLDQHFLLNEIHCEMDRHDINLFDI